MKIQSDVILKVTGTGRSGGDPAPVAYRTQDNNAPQLRRHLWLVITHFVEVYQPYLAVSLLRAELHTLGEAVWDLADELEVPHVRVEP